MKELSYSILIDKPQEFVFNKIMDKSTYADWAKAWGEGMDYEGEWEAGNHITFFDGDKGGTKVIIEEFTPHKAIKAKHVAMVNVNSEEIEPTDDMMRKWIGSKESYFFIPEGDSQTTMKVVMVVDEAFEEMMNAWHKALAYFKAVCED